MGIPNEFVELSEEYLWSVSWQVSILVVLVWLIARFTQGGPARWHYGLWLLVVIRLALPAHFPAPFDR